MTWFDWLMLINARNCSLHHVFQISLINHISTELNLIITTLGSFTSIFFRIKNFFPVGACTPSSAFAFKYIPAESVKLACWQLCNLNSPTVPHSQRTANRGGKAIQAVDCRHSSLMAAHVCRWLSKKGYYKRWDRQNCRFSHLKHWSMLRWKCVPI